MVILAYDIATPVDIGARVDGDTQAAIIAGHLNVQYAHAVALIAELLDTGDWAGHGIHSPEHWVKLRFGVTHARARTLVNVARRWRDFPSTMAEFAAGGLSLEQVEVVVTRAPVWADPRLADFASALTVPQLHRVIRDEYFDPDPDEPADTEAAPDSDEPVPEEPQPTAVPGQPADRFHYSWQAGRLVGSFDLAADRGAVIEAALQQIRDELFRQHRTPASNAEAFSELVARATTSPSDQLISREWGNGSQTLDAFGRFRTFLHLDITAGGERLIAQLTNGTTLPDAVRHYLTCDGTITPVWERDHTPIGYGRRQRIVPTKLRRLVQRRDRGCRVPGCGNHHIEVHHIAHWEDGGATEMWNLVSLCPAHHRLHHLGQLTIRGNPDADTLEFFDATGQPIRGPSYAKPTEPPPDPARPYEHLDLRWFAGWTHPNNLRPNPYTDHPGGS